MSYFYEGLTPSELQFVEMMCNGEFLQKDHDEAIEYLNELAEKAYTWIGPSATEGTNRSRPAGNPNGGGIYHLREEDSLKARVEMLTRQLNVLKTKNLKPTHVANHAESFGPYFVCGGVVEENNEIKSQVSKLMRSLSVNERDKFHSQAQSIPQCQHMAQGNLKEVNAIVTQSGKSSHIPTTDKPDDVDEEQSKDSAELPKETEVIKSPVKVPFPQALKSSKRTLDPNNEILENLRQVKINLPLLHVIKQVPTYIKLLNDLCIVKRKHHVKKTAFLIEQVSALIEQRIPPKYKDPGCPTIVCSIGNHEFGQALLDLGASVNLMPYSIYLRLGLGEIKPTTVVLQLANRSVKVHRGVVEDVLIQIDKFYYPVDFLILDTSFAVDTTSKIPLILGRHFLATANALINCRNGLMKLSFGNMTLEDYGTRAWKLKFEELPEKGEKQIPSSVEAPKVKLKPLPKGLKHAFLDPSDTFPVIISSELSQSQGVVLGQRREGKPFVIYYASRILNSAQMNYLTTEKELLAVVFALDKFCAYLIGSPIIIFTDHAALKYFLTKKDAKARLIRWILLLQEFDITIKEKKGVENVVVDHLSRLTFEDTSDHLPIRDDFPDEHLLSITSLP
ncbi:uncharacterized protein LOC108995832 [Juglans regia]|uniref:Uncharacterized protein LOC108995832 n=1 Tax=Juglans regia TaxID=51240 RepID=A0A6P9EV35_JUGRE|nr:uncharacterized protein LOC108995832 [Juglans regia]